MKGYIVTNYYYLWSPSDKNQPQSYLISKMEETNLVLRKVSHLNLISIRKIIAEKDIVGIPDLKICSDCWVRK